MRMYVPMGEIDPSDQLDELDALRRSMLRPRAARKVLWLASSQIMADKTFNESERRLVGRYLETIFNALDKSEEQDAACAQKEEQPVETPINMGSLMSWAFTDVYRETFPAGYDASNRAHRDANVYMRLNVGMAEAYMGDAYQKYLEQQEAQTRDAGRLSLKWF